MNMDTRETLKKVAEYAENEKKVMAKKMCSMTGGALLLLVASEIMRYTEIANMTGPYQNFSGFALALAMASMGLNILYFAGVFDRIAERKKAKRK